MSLFLKLVFLCTISKILFFVQGTCSNINNQYPKIDRTDPELNNAYQKINLEIQKFRWQNKLPGFGINIVYGDEILFSKSYGSRDRSHPIVSPLFTLDDSIRIGSITKSFTALLMYKMRDEGLINLNDKLIKYLPQFRMKSIFNSTSDDITLSQLASHRSGLPRDVPCDSTEYGTDKCNFDKVLEDLKDMYLEFPVDFIGFYSNLGFSLLGKALEIRLNETFEEVIKREFLIPLGMMNSHFETTQLNKPLARSMIENSDGFAIYNVSNSLNSWTPMGGILSTSNDMAKFVSFLLKKPKDSKVLKYETLMESLIETWRGNNHFSYSTPWENIYDTENSLLVRGKNGFYEGYLSQVTFVKELNYGFFFISLSDSESSALLSQKISSILTPVFRKKMCNQWNELFHLTTSRIVSSSNSSVGNSSKVSEYYEIIGTYAERNNKYAFTISSITNCSGITNNIYCNKEIQLISTDLLPNSIVLFIPLKQDDKSIFRIQTNDNISTEHGLIYYHPRSQDVKQPYLSYDGDILEKQY